MQSFTPSSSAIINDALEKFETPQKRKRKTGDATWSRKSDSRSCSPQTPQRPAGNRYGFLPMRADTSKFIEKDGEEVLIQNAVVVHGSPVGIKNKDEAKLVSEKMSEIISATPQLKDSHVSIAEVQYDPETGTPVKVFTKRRRTEFHKTDKIGPLRRFSTKAHEHAGSLNKLFDRAKLLSSKVYELTKENNLSVKEIKIKITPEHIKKVKEKIKALGKSRNQNAVMSKSAANAKEVTAKKYAAAAGFEYPGLKFEWTHFLAWVLMGPTGQTDKNMGDASFHANTNMEFLNLQVPNFLDAYPEGFDFFVQGHFMTEEDDEKAANSKTENESKSTQILKKIDCHIITPDRTFTFEFDALEINQPAFNNIFYVNGLVKALLSLDAEKNNAAQTDEKDSEVENFDGENTGIPVYFKTPVKMATAIAGMNLFATTAATSSSSVSVSASASAAIPVNSTAAAATAASSTSPATTAALYAYARSIYNK